MLRDRVADRAELGEQAGGRRGAGEVALAALEHPGEERAGRPTRGLSVLTRHSVSQSASRMLGPPLGPVMPAFEKKRSIGPLAASAFSTSSLLHPPRGRRRPRRRARRRPAVFASSRSSRDRGRRPLHGGLLLGEADCERAADTAARAGDDDVPACKIDRAGAEGWVPTKSRQIRLARRRVVSPSPRLRARRGRGREPEDGELARPQHCSCASTRTCAGA